MIKKFHTAYIGVLISIIVFVTTYISYVGMDFYKTPIEERFYHAQYDWFKPSGLFGHGLGIIGTLLITIGVVMYTLAKKYGFLTRVIRLKYLLEFHIFLCTLGPILILFHTTFKFGGVVSIAFWSMVAVVLSGVIGRFIYIQIPRSIEGRELSLTEIRTNQEKIIEKIKSLKLPNDQIIHELADKSCLEGSYLQSRRRQGKYIRSLKKLINAQITDKKEQRSVMNLVRSEIALSSRIANLNRMQKLFKYWHVAHKPFALIMLIVVVIHVVVTLLFGYTWIF